MAIIDSYDIYSLSGTGRAHHPFTVDQGQNPVLTSQNIYDTNITGNTQVLGDVPFDSFAEQSQTLGYLLYTGFVSYKLVDGTTAQAAIGETQDGSYYMFVNAGTPMPATSATLTFTKNVFGKGVTEWDIAQERPYCFLAGTALLTPAGERAVDDLRAGDMVVTAGGAVVPIRWIGTTVIASIFADPLRAMPVRIKAGALSENTPSRDLLLSPGHAILVDGILAHAGALVNGVSILHEKDMPLLFSYYHVELDAHELVMAENTPAESFLEAVSDIRTDNFPERSTLPGAAPTAEMELPRVKAARQLPQSVRTRIATRAELFHTEMNVAA